MAPSKEKDTDSVLHSAKKRKRDKTQDLLASKKRRSELAENGVHNRRNGVAGGEPEEVGLAESMDLELSSFAQPRSKKGVKSKGKHHSLKSSSTPWKVLPPMGGRMSDIDPIFSPDEEHLIITYNTSLQVYSTSNSLLVRRIVIPLATNGESSGSPRAYIVASVISQVNPNFVWVACSDGRIWRIDWTTGAGTDAHFQCPSRSILDMTVVSILTGSKGHDTVLVSEKDKQNRSGFHIVAYDLDEFTAPRSKVLHTQDTAIQLLRTANHGRFLFGSAKDVILAGVLESEATLRLEDLQYTTYSFDTSDDVCSLDIRVSTGRRGKSKDNSYNADDHVDLVLGCVRGSMLVYQDIVTKVQGKKGSIKPQKHHWHRKAVHTVKWSRDGNYLISGGAEAVLVLWQLDTGRRNYLPHLSGSIENIVVSPRGSSYAIHLDDNSTMVLSTAEMKPSAYVSGLQALVFSDKPSKDSLVRRLWNSEERISKPLVAAMSPSNSSRMLLCVGNGQQARTKDSAPSLPLLQTFDIASFQSVSRQALARANLTDHNMTSKGLPVIDPRVTHLAFSSNGTWLATVDEWQPPERDLEPLVDQPQSEKETSLEKREISLKFWDVGTDAAATLSLVSKVNDPHFAEHIESVLGLASDKTSPRFATVGADGVVLFWTPRLRQRDGIVSTGADGQPLCSWACSKAVTLGESAGLQDDLAPLDVPAKTKRSGAVAFSEDGSILFAAFGNRDEAVVYTVDPDSGEVRNTLHGLFRGDVRDIQVLGSHLILLSEDLTVYDIVTDELCYGIELAHEPSIASKMTQLAVDHKSRTFAVAVPRHPADQDHFTRTSSSELAVFTPDDSEPQILQRFPQLITALIPIGGSTGYLALDAAAQIWSIVEGTGAAPTVQPLATLNLDGCATEVQEGESGKVIQLNGFDDSGSDDGEDEVMEDVEMDDYDAHPAVFAPQRLAEVFEAAPAFAMPPIKDIFYQVTSLLSSKPITAPTS